MTCSSQMRWQEAATVLPHLILASDWKSNLRFLSSYIYHNMNNIGIPMYRRSPTAHNQSLFFGVPIFPPCRLQSRGPLRKTSMDTRQAFLVSMVKAHYWRQAVHLLEFRKAWGSPSQLIRKADLLPAMQVTRSWLKALRD